jgi:hypothetical protein
MESELNRCHTTAYIGRGDDYQIAGDGTYRDQENEWINYPQKCIRRNEPQKWKNVYTIVGLNRLLDTSHRDVKHELLQSIPNGTGPAASIALIRS